MPSFLETAVDTAYEAGALVESFAARRIGFELKGPSDLVTEADRASEKLIAGRLRAAFPGHGIFGEEGSRENLDAEYRWYIDPVDGTSNFAHGFPVYNVTMALEHRGTLVAGVVYDPTRKEMFAAERGSGAYLNSRRLRVSAASRIEDLLVATGFPNARRHLSVNVHFFYQFAMMSHGVRRAGSAAIDLAYVAAGRLDAFWEFGLSPWDLAAGKLLIEEAGGIVTGMKGEAHTMESQHLLGANANAHAAIVAMFTDIFEGRPAFRIPDVLR